MKENETVNYTLTLKIGPKIDQLDTRLRHGNKFVWVTFIFQHISVNNEKIHELVNCHGA